MNENAKRYGKEFAAAMVCYGVLLPLSIHLLKSDPQSPWRVVWALLPVVPAPFAIAAVVRFYRGLDELHRRIHLEGLSYSFPATFLFTMTYGFLQNAGFPPLDLVQLASGMIGLWGLGLGIAARKYR
jgi:hypothetical protein